MIKVLNKICKSGVAIAATLMVVSCSTQKAKWSNIQYHNTTTHYNVWWNGNESLKKGVEQLSSKVKDDYTQILPVYKVGTKEEAMSFNPQFDRAIEKSVKGIKKHSIFINGQEHVPYISKCYLMMAYATFYKHDYVNAASTCQMLQNQYSGTEIADEAAVLAARCSTQDKRYRDAESSLDDLVANLGKGNFSNRQKLNLYLAMAECTLPQEKYKKAAQFLKEALECRPSQTQKARICFILGQIYQSQDKRPTATKYYEEVLKCGPGYEMEFNARLSLASCADLQHTDQAKLERLLDKMLKDKKNEEFLDQIYYAKGEMYLGMREMNKACDAFRTSCAVSKNNPAQKARSALRLGSIMYEKLQDYDHSQIYYDTAINIIKKDYPRYATIKSRYDLLTSLTTYTRVIARNDSLFVVADMPEVKRNELIRSKIEALEKAEKEAKERELIEQLTADSKGSGNTLTGEWYFYNSNTVQKGKETFRQRWGMRALEDYWFLAKKGFLGSNMIMIDDPKNDSDNDTSSLANGDTVAVSDSAARLKGNPNDPHYPAYYLKELPTTQAQRDSMMYEIAVGLLNAGYIYYDGIRNIPKALECYLRLVNNYPEHDDIVQAFYMLYKVYDKQGNTPSANYYRDMVLMGFPDSDFSNLILDEDYYKEIIHRGQLIRDDYAELFSLYRKRRYSEVITAVDNAHEIYPGNPMLGKFDYWKGLSYARMDDKSNAIATFQSILNQYPATDSIYPYAEAQLAFLNGEGGNYVVNSGNTATLDTLSALSPEVVVNKPNNRLSATKSVSSEDALPPEAQLFRYKADMQHLVIIIVNDKKIKSTQLRGKVGNFIGTYYSNAGLQVKPLMFTDSTQLLYINTFVNAQSAIDFATHLQLSEGPMADYQQSDYKIFAISKQNYTTFYNRKQVDAYQLFYNKYYIK